MKIALGIYTVTALGLGTVVALAIPDAQKEGVIPTPLPTKTKVRLGVALATWPVSIPAGIALTVKKKQAAK